MALAAAVPPTVADLFIAVTPVAAYDMLAAMAAACVVVEAGVMRMAVVRVRFFVRAPPLDGRE